MEQVIVLAHESLFKENFLKILSDNGLSTGHVIDYDVDPNVTYADFLYYFEALSLETRRTLETRLIRLSSEGFQPLRDNLHYLINTYKY